MIKNAEKCVFLSKKCVKPLKNGLLVRFFT